MKKNTKKHHVLTIIGCIFITISCILFSAALWYANVYGFTGFNSILFTLFGNISGADASLFWNYLIYSLIPGIAAAVLLSLLLWFRTKKEKPENGETPSKKYIIRDRLSLITSICISVILLVFTAQISGLNDWIVNYFTVSDLFEKEYVEPNAADITFPEQKQNLIVIYLESMESTFFDKTHGGAMDKNVISELYDLAQTNINFSDNNDVGGFLEAKGCTWTIGAMVGQSSGIPLHCFIDEANSLDNKQYFLKGLTTINDILHNNGYYQTLMVGSDANFGGRKKYYTEHGVDRVYDYYTAVTDQIIPENYKVWWGMEDQKLYQYAKKELPKIAAQEQPFCFTMLTVDTHHIGGYVCDNCENVYSEQYENVYACASKQIKEFIDWAKTQPFYANTTIVITGDHCSMDSDFFKRNVESSYTRHVYNCFINSKATATNTKNRIMTTLDIFPTTLAAMGCSFDDDRLGLGTNLFSDEETLAEKYGYNEFCTYLDQNSVFYDEHFKFND